MIDILGFFTGGTVSWCEDWWCSGVGSYLGICLLV
jgi:hypothetical protein